MQQIAGMAPYSGFANMQVTPQQPLQSDLGNKILKVNHAGENGAVRIYQGQILAAKLYSKNLARELIECKSHEERHLKIFESELAKRKQPRCKNYHICSVGGFVLGIITGLCGSGAISATTQSVESVVLKHLKHQISVLKGVDESAVTAIKSILSEEQAHHDLFTAKLNPHSIWLKIFSPVVTLSTELVIWLGMKL
jgi:ubiquinone biosynthesis monooxygenase Coq7